MHSKNLLIIAHTYAMFVKDQVDLLSQYFNHVYVLVRHNPIAEVSRLFPVEYLKMSSKQVLIDLTNKPRNVTVIPTSIPYLPTDKGYKGLGEKHFKAAARAITDHNIKFDLIHAHFLWSAGYAGARLKEKYKAPFVVTAHGYDIYDLPFRDTQWRDRIKFVLSKADCVITVSGRNSACIREINENTNVKIIPNGFRNDLFYPRDMNDCRRGLGLPSDRRILVTVGNLKKVKGHTYLIGSIGEIVKRGWDVLCVIVGSGQLKQALQTQIEKEKLASHIVLAGARSHNEIPLWINAADIFVLPSLDEGNPTVMFESLSCGKPFVGTKVGGIPDVIRSEKYGRLCEPGNIEELAEKIITALDQQWDRQEIIDYAKRYSWNHITKEILDVYRFI